MALSVKKGTFNCPTVTGNLDITDAGFQPLAVILFSTQQTSSGITTNAPATVGMATNRGGTVQQCVVASMSNEFEPPTSATRAGTANTGRAVRSDAVFVGLSSGSPAVDCLATFVSFLSNGFRLNFSDAAGTAGQVVHYLALGGTDLTDAKVGAHTVVRTTAGTEATSGLGFAPDALITLSGTNIASPSAVEDPISFGFARRNPTEQAAAAFFDKDAQATMQCVNSARSDSCVIIPGLTTAIEAWAAMSSWDADGFTLNWLDPVGTASNRVFFYLALKGGQYKIGAQAAPTSTGSVDYTGVGFTPKGLLISASMLTTDNTNSAVLVDSGWGMGASDGTNDGAIANSQQDANTNSMAHRSSTTTKAISLVKGTTTPTLSEEADLTSFASGQFTLNWTTVDASNARRWYWLAIGDAAGAAAYSLDAQPGSYAVTGAAASTVSGRFVNAAPASYALTGTAATLGAGRVVNAGPGSYGLTGTAASLVTDRMVNATAGSYTVTGIAATPAAGRVLNAAPGVYTITGSDANLVYVPVSGAFTLDASPGAYTTTGAAASLLSTRLVNAAPGVYTLSGAAASLVAARFVNATPGTYSLTGSTASLAVSRALNAAAGVYTLTGPSTTLLPVRLLTASPGSYVVTGADAGLTSAGTVSPGAVAISDTSQVVLTVGDATGASVTVGNVTGYGYGAAVSDSTGQEAAVTDSSGASVAVTDREP